jgi:orotate phosphoribosyltransferase
MPHGKRIAEHLLNIGAVKLSPLKPFTWTSGIKSPIYCDNRMIYSHPEARDFVAAALSNRVKNLHVEADVIAGTADRLGLPFVYVRSKPKEHGAKKMIEGDLRPQSHVVVVEDLISTAKSSALTVEALREEGKCFVTDVVSIFSYELVSGLEKARELKVRLHPLCSIGTLLDTAVEQDRITEEEARMVAEFSRDPEGWGPKHGF